MYYIGQKYTEQKNMNTEKYFMEYSITEGTSGIYYWKEIINKIDEKM